MSSTIRENPSERLGARQSRELTTPEEAARQLQQQNLDIASDNSTGTRHPTTRLTALVDRATQTTPQTEQAKGTSTVGATGAAPLNRGAAIDELGGHQQVFGTGETRLGPATAPRIQLTAQHISGAESFANNLDAAMSNVLANAARLNATGHLHASDVTTGSGTGRAHGRIIDSGIRGLGPDELLAEFLKLNINDPNENVETHNKLTELSSKLRQQALDDAKKQSENAQKMMKEAQEYAKQAEMIGTVVQVASIALTVCTLGVGAVAAVPAAAAAQVGTQVAAQAGQQMLQQAAQESLKEVVKEAVKETTQTLVKQGVELTSEVAQKAITEATQKATQAFIQANQQAFQQAVQQTVQEAAKQGVQLTTQQAETLVTQQINNSLLPQVTQELSTQLATQGMTASSQTATQVGTQLAEHTASRTATTGVQGFVNRATDVLGHMNQGVAGHMARATVIGAGVGQIVAAGAQYRSADKMADARQAQLEVTRSKFRAEQAQQVIEQEGDIINTIMESKNQTIDAVMQMTNATWASRQQLLAATMAR